MKPDYSIPNFEFYNSDNMDIMKNYPDKYFDLAIVDPPYGLGESVVNSSGRFKRYHNKNGNWDLNIPSNDYFNQLFRISKNQIIWGGNYFNLPPNKCFIIWDKQQPEDISFAMAEYAWSSFNKVSSIFKCRVIGQENRTHPTAKPILLYDWLIKKYANENDKIIDTHLGSNSIGIAIDKANELDKKNLSFVGIELDKDYFDAAIKRFRIHKRQLNLFQ